ncbi:MAG TPA: hypothetical protein VFB22_06740 [Candidatus Baltobacteraceae bacterium]|nr:hypothetical protein [Candidatus Baltobacteraceae bacterium]
MRGTNPPRESPRAALLAATPPAYPGEGADGDIDVRATLPREHPAWQRDVLSVSSRARETLARLRPVVIRVLTFWDHVVRAAAIGHRRLEIDPSGCYRLR